MTPIIDEYVKEGFDFPRDEAAAEPRRAGDATGSRDHARARPLSLPLRMAAIGTGASVGITIWVVSDGRYEPQNFPFYHIEDSDLIWDFGTSARATTRPSAIATRDGARRQRLGDRELARPERAEHLEHHLVRRSVQLRTVVTLDAGSDYLPVVSSGDGANAR